MLDPAIRMQLAAYLKRLKHPIELIATLDTSEKSQEMRGLLDDIAALSDKVSVRHNGQDARTPSFAIARPGETARIHFAGIPMGHEFTSLVLALLHTGGHPPKVEDAQLEQIRALSGEFRFETFISLSCHNCPDVVQALNLMAAQNPGISHTMIDGVLFPKEIEERQIMAVPVIFLNGQPFDQGRMTLEEIIAKIDTGAVARAAEKLAAKKVFDVLVVGGGPAGSAAAIYAARKGLRTGIVAERFGGQILDTLSIENFISVKETEGPKLAAALEEHVRHYDVDIMNLQRAEALTQDENGVTAIRLASGATVRGKTVILATGARWRNMDVPGEQEYKARGVAYCPHCDGPLYKGKRVAVVGGGNSGVEAAIDLAGIAAHVTLLARSQVRADAALLARLEALPNMTVIADTLPAEVTGDGQKVTGFSWSDKNSGAAQHIELEGIFVQIGLVANAEWLKGSLALSPRGEIEIDAKCQTSLPGVFAAGDCSTVPYKQIIVAMGEGAKASLSAFDHLIRSGR